MGQSYSEFTRKKRPLPYKECPNPVIPYIFLGAHHNIAALATATEIAMQFMAIASDITINVYGHLPFVQLGVTWWQNSRYLFVQFVKYIWTNSPVVKCGIYKSAEVIDEVGSLILVGNIIF